MKQLSIKPCKTDIQIQLDGKGAFNPVLLKPKWLFNYKLLGKKETENAKISLKYKDYVALELDYCKLELNSDTFLVGVDQVEYLEQTIDLVSGILKLAKNNPITSVAFIWFYHFDLKEEKRIQELFNKLATGNNIWNEITGLSSYNKFTVKQSKPKSEEFDGSVEVNVEVCQKYDNNIHIVVVDKYDYGPDTYSTEKSVKTLVREIDGAKNNAFKIMNNILSYDK